MKKHFKTMDLVQENILEPRATIGFNNPISLNGQWQFKWFENTNDLNKYEGEIDEMITVPSNWEFEGYSKPNYLNIKYPKALKTKNIPQIDESINECAIYEKEIIIEKAYPVEDAYIHLAGVRSAFDLYLNDVYIGFGQGANTPKGLYLGDQLKEGTNSLRIIVYKYAVGTYLEDQDMWRLAGIFRSVTLHTMNRFDLKDVQIKAKPVNGYKDGHLCMQMESGVERIEVTVDELDLKYMSSFKGGKHIIDETIDDVNLWSAEFPNLYTLEIKGFNQNKEQFNKRVKCGFRDIKTNDNGLFINGQSVLIKGVNRHEFHPEKGHAIDVEDIRRDLILLKDYHVNAIRTSHYPNMEAFYDLCDEMGFYVMDEANIETHGLRHKLPKSSLEWLPHCIDRVDRMVRRDINHPSIIFWSLGNEAGYGDVFKSMKGHILSIDQSRPIHYEGDHTLDISDVFSTMYSTPQETEKVGKGESIRAGYLEQDYPLGKKITPKQYADKPFIICEFGHAMMNSLGNFKEYMDAFRAHDRCIGGFIWDFSDQSITLNGRKGQYGGDFYPDYNDGFFCANGIFDGYRNPYPSALEVKYHFNPIRFKKCEEELEVYNENSFTNIINSLLIIDYVKDESILHSFDIPLTLQALSKIMIPIDLSIEYDWINVKVIDTFGDLVAHDQFVKSMPKHTLNEKGYKFDIDTKTGMLCKIEKDDINILCKHMEFNFHRAPIGNDWNYGNFFKILKKDSPWKGAEDHLVVKSADTFSDGLVFHYTHRFFKELTLTYKFLNGKLHVEAKCIPKKDMIRFGLTLTFDKVFKDCSYLGRGPYENYHDRKSGALVGKYESAIEDMMTHYMVPQENGNRTDSNYIKLCGDKMIEFASEGTFDFSIWPYEQNDLYAWTHDDQVEDKGLITLNIDAKQIGVGGEKPGVLHLHEKYKMKKNKEYSFEFTMG